MTEDEFLVCPACGRAEPGAERTACPDCGSDRTYRSPEPALPDATAEAYVKLDADEAAAVSDAEKPDEPDEAEPSDRDG